MATTYNNLYLDIRQQLRRAGIEEATLEARELVCFGTNKSREELARDGGLYASPELEHRVRDLVRRHLEGEPVAYLIGEWEFYGLPLDISRDVLIPRPDTEVLAEQAIGYIKTLGECRVLDLCAGSGCIGLAVAAQVPQARVVLGEWSDGALKICRQNVRRNSLTARVVPMQADAREKPEKSLGEFQCIVSNHLAPGGRLYFEVGIGQADNVLRIMRTQGFGDIQVVKDHHDIPRVVFGTLCTEL